MKMDDDTYPFNEKEEESRHKFFNTRFSDIGPRKRSADRWPEENMGDAATTMSQAAVGA